MSVANVGRYEILQTIGRGAMGIVYLARDPLIDRKVALKTLRLDVDAEMAAEFRERFLREAQAAGRLNHPGIVTIHDVGEDRESGILYIAMEYIEGRDLKQILASGHRFRPSETARIVADVASALDYAHQMGVVHRDIKPANVILTQDGSARITDFGVARLESSNLTVDGQFIGTPNFMSPEQITGQPVDGRSDLFSLGVVLFTLLTGQRPYTGETMHQVTRMIVDEPCPIPSTVNEGVPPAFNPIVIKSLDKDPDRRFQTGGQLASVLAALARSLVRREPGDEAGTVVHSPDLETRTDKPAPVADGARADEAGAASPPVRGRPFWKTIDLPEPLTWEVSPIWAWTMIGACAIACGISIGYLLTQRDSGPFAAPSAGATSNLRRTAAALWSAEDALAVKDYHAAASNVWKAIDQAPGSPAARALAAEVGHRIEDERTSAETQQRVADLVDEGRRLYRRGEYSSAAVRFRQALELDPQSEIASSYLELAEERWRQARSRRSAAAPTPAPGSQLKVTQADLPTPSPTPGTVRLTVYFHSLINDGSIVVAIDGVTLAEIPFDHTTRGFLGFKKSGSGTVKRVLLAPSGTHDVSVSLNDRKRGLVGSRTFRNTLLAGTEWTLRIDQPDRDAAPSFFLVRRNR